MKKRLIPVMRGLALMLTMVIGLNVSSVRAANTFTKDDVLKLITNAGNSSSVIVGQNCGDGLDIITKYPALITTLKNNTGKLASICGVDYEYGGKLTSTQLSQINSTLISHWNQGGLVELTWHANNPWTNGNCRDFTNVALADLVNTSKPIYTAWHNELDRIAAALLELKNNGVTVIWRPFHEMNGNWFWWGFQGQQDYKNMWIDMYNYFTNTKGLNNLIWAYGAAPYVDPLWSKPVDSYYPGGSYVDIVGCDLYNNNIETNFIDYNTMLAMGKPIALTEAGPSTSTADGSFDDTKYLTVKVNYPKVSYFLSWHDWPGATVSIIANTKSDTLMNSTKAITADKLSSLLNSNLIANPGFESSFTNWSTSSGTVASTIATTGAHSGTKCAMITAKSNFTSYIGNTTATNCQAGTYTATVWVKGSGTWNWSALELKNGSTTLGSAIITPSSTWKQVTISNITIAQGTNLTLDVWANANANSAFYLDDFSLVKN